MNEGRPEPAVLVMALAAGLGIALGHMVGRGLIVSQVAGDAVISSGRVFEASPRPGGGLMAGSTVPSIAGAGVPRGRSKLALMAQIAFFRGPLEIPRGGIKVALFAAQDRVPAGKGEAGAGVVGYLGSLARPPFPGVLVMAALAVAPQGAPVRVYVAAGAAARGVSLGRAAVIVAAQAGRFGMRAFQRIAGLLEVIELEIGAYDVPAAGQMAEGAVAGKSFVRDKRAPLLLPAELPRKPGRSGGRQRPGGRRCSRESRG